MPDDTLRPAWSNQFQPSAIQSLDLFGIFHEINREWAWGGGTGKGVRIAVVDSGVEHDHPALEGCVVSGVKVEIDDDTEEGYRILDDNPPVDLVGHGTACTGIIHSIAPEAEIFSVRVLGRSATGRALQFAAGVEWALDNNMQICNLSLSTSSESYYAMFHKLADAAYFKNMMLVSAVNNIPAPSYPSLYSSVISVAAHEMKDPFVYYYNPEPPVEFGAPGIDVRVPWLNKSYSTTTGNSFAAPHITGLVALLLSKHPNLTPFLIKTILYACASNPNIPNK